VPAACAADDPREHPVCCDAAIAGVVAPLVLRRFPFTDGHDRLVRVGVGYAVSTATRLTEVRAVFDQRLDTAAGDRELVLMHERSDGLPRLVARASLEALLDERRGVVVGYEPRALADPGVAHGRGRDVHAIGERSSCGLRVVVGQATALHPRRGQHERHHQLAHWRRRVDPEIDRGDGTSRRMDLLDQLERVSDTEPAETIEFGDGDAFRFARFDPLEGSRQPWPFQLAA
jgi:hypothetical protein